MKSAYLSVVPLKFVKIARRGCHIVLTNKDNICDKRNISLNLYPAMWLF